MDCRQENKSRRSITGGAAALPHRSPSTGPGAVYPSHILTLTNTEELQPILTTDQYLYGSITLLLQVNNPICKFWDKQAGWRRRVSTNVYKSDTFYTEYLHYKS